MALKTFFADLVARGPLLVLGGGAFFATSNSSKQYIEFADGEKLGLVPAETLSELVKFYYHRNKNEFYSFKKKFIESKLEQDFQTAEERTKELDKRGILNFIVKDLMPFMSGHKEELDELFGEEIKKQKIETKEVNETELLRELEKVKNELKEQEYRQGVANFGNTDEVTYLSSLLRGNIITFGEKVYHLENTDRKNADLTVMLDREINFKSKELCKSSEIEEKYSSFIEWKQGLEAIEEFSDFIKEKQKIKLATFKDFDKIIQLKEFNEGYVGFLQERDYTYVYQIIPPFAMLDPRPAKQGICYEFPRLRVGMPIYFDNYYKQISLGRAVLFEPVWHPFVPSENTPLQQICIESHTPKLGNDVEWVAKKLDDAKNVIMHGLTPESIKQHGGNETYGGGYWTVDLDKKLEKRKISCEEAERKGLLIANKWEWR